MAYPSIQLPMKPNAFSRREFLSLTTLGVLGHWLPWTPTLSAASDVTSWDPHRPFPGLGQELRVQPIFMYRLPEKMEMASWRSWGGIQSEAAVAEEINRITSELYTLHSQAGFPLRILPAAKVTSLQDAEKLAATDYHVTLLYACTGSGEVLRRCMDLKPDTLVFVRHRSGPIYYWYEALSVKYLRKGPAGSPSGDPPGNVHVDDVVVDDYNEVLWRLRALSGIRNLLESRIVALGGPWGKYAPDAPQKAQERFRLHIIDAAYEDFEPRLQSAKADASRMSRARQWTEQFLSLPGTELLTQKQYVVNAFLLYDLFQELMREHEAAVFTIKNCMRTIIPMAETTACLTLALLNDDGRIAFCESDFVAIPPGLLLRYIANKPVFLHNSTFPHQGLVTCAHCTCPRRLDGNNYEPVKIVTHYESDYGAAPKVEIPVGQEVTFVDPDYSHPRWVGFKGTVSSNPFYEICRSQQDVNIQGNWKGLLDEVRDSHWIMVYGDYLKELAYAARKLGIQWATLT